MVWHHLWKKRSSEGKEDGREEDDANSDLALDEDFEKGTEPMNFSFNELVLATSNFADKEKLRGGGFGGVYMLGS